MKLKRDGNLGIEKAVGATLSGKRYYIFELLVNTRLDVPIKPDNKK